MDPTVRLFGSLKAPCLPKCGLTRLRYSIALLELVGNQDSSFRAEGGLAVLAFDATA